MRIAAAKFAAGILEMLWQSVDRGIRQKFCLGIESGIEPQIIKQCTTYNIS
jgi:hypothetical protein